MMPFVFVLIIFMALMPCTANRRNHRIQTWRRNERHVRKEYDEAFEMFKNPSVSTDVSQQFLVTHSQLKHWDIVTKMFKTHTAITFSPEKLSNPFIETGLTPAEVLAIYQYTHMDYQQINKHLRGVKVDGTTYNNYSSPKLAELVEAWNVQRPGEEPPWGAPAPDSWVGWTTPEWRDKDVAFIDGGLKKLRNKQVSWNYIGFDSLNLPNLKRWKTADDTVTVNIGVASKDLYRGFGTLPKQMKDKFNDWIDNDGPHSDNYFVDPAFSSTTADQEFALKWAAKYTDQSSRDCKDRAYAIKIVAGEINHYAHDITWLSQAKDHEEEYLMERALKLSYRGKYEQKNILHPGPSHYPCAWNMIRVYLLEMELQ